VETPLSNDDVVTMTVPLWEQAKAAMAEGDVDWALELIDQAVDRWRSLQDYSINWITSLLSFIGRELGEEAVERAPRTFMRDELPVYCAHCSVNNEMQAVEWMGYPMTIETPSTGKGGRCVHHVYRDLDAISEDVYRRIGKDKPTS
jgi:hypothetical protein